MPVGSYYYPEHWPEEEWEKDIKRMSALGFEFTHFAEFAWAKMEPREGEFNFEWLDRCLNLAEKHDLQVVMCTPTPTPPAWLTQKHPEILLVNSEGRRLIHGSRLHVQYDHPMYLVYVERIIREMGKRYGNHPAVAGWQLDNEPHFGMLYDYSEYSRDKFHSWLRKRYITINRLNQVWGTSFWSQTYNNFEQIPLPNSNRLPAGANPHAMLDFNRFMAARVADGLAFQSKELKKHINNSQWVTTNYAYYKFLPVVDPFLTRDILDFTSHTMYLTSNVLNDEGGKLAFRLGSGMELSFSNEMAASVHGTTGIMELQPGQINWGKINPQPLPGAIRMYIWHSFALGDEFVCNYRFRQPLFGGEQTHKGIIDTDGKKIARGGKEYITAIKEIQKLESNPSGLKLPEDYVSRKTAMLWDQQNIMDIENHRHHKDFDPWQHIYCYYENLKTMGCPVSFIQRKDTVNPGQHPFMIVPAFQLVTQKLITKWEQYVKEGGNLIITSRTAKKDTNGHLWKMHNQQLIWDLIGAKIEEFDHLPAKYPGNVVYNNEEYSWHIWGDWLDPYKKTEVLAEYSDQFYAGTPAIVTRKLGGGSVTYIGVFTDSWELERKVLRFIYSRAGAEIFNMPRYVFTEYRDGYWVTVNYSSVSVNAPLHHNAQIIYGTKKVEPGQVCVWKTK
jgi:beta-galactosidase